MEGTCGKMSMPANLFGRPDCLNVDEVTEMLLQREGARVERIFSTGQASPADFWYDQDEEEWVVVLQGDATLQWEDLSLTEMGAGDWVLIPAHKKHRVERTSIAPPCIWLAMFFLPSPHAKLCP